MSVENPAKYTYVNGTLVISGESKILAPCLFYESVTDTLRTYFTHNGHHILHVEAHLNRLKSNCEALNIPFNWKIQKLITDIYHLLEINKHKNTMIQIIVSVPVNYHLKKQNHSIITIKTWDWVSQKINNQQHVNFENLPSSLLLQYAKSSRYMPILYDLKKKCEQAGFNQSILIDSETEELIQGIQGHLFIEKNGEIFTPQHTKKSYSITQNTLLSICKKLEIELIEKPLYKADILNADSAFFAGTTAEISGIKTIEHQTLPLDWHKSIGSSLSISYKHLAMERENYEVII